MKSAEKLIMSDTVKQTILLVCNTAWGIANFRANIITHWIDQGKRVIAIAPTDSKAEAKLVQLGAEFIPLALDNRGSNPIQEIKLVWQLVQYYRQYRPMLVIHYTIKPVIYGSWAAKLAGVPSLAVVTGQGFAFLNQGVKAWVARNLYRTALRFSQRVWFLNQDDATRFIDSGLVKADKVAILPGEGVNTDDFVPRDNSHRDSSIRILLVARLLYDKGIAEFAEAGRLLQQQQHQAADHHAVNPRNVHEHDEMLHLPAIRLQLLGPFYPQNPQAISPETIAHWQAEGWLEYLGETDDVRDYLANCDALALPSYGEGLPRTVLEAMSMAKPVIASDVTGCRDLVQTGKTGLLCPAKDAQALADSIAQFAQLSMEARHEMGRLGRERVMNAFSDAQVIAQYDAFLAKMTLCDHR